MSKRPAQLEVAEAGSSSEESDVELPGGDDDDEAGSDAGEALASTLRAAASSADDDVVVERVLCCNVIQREGDGGVFRHPIYAYDEKLAWPPSGWQTMSCWHCSQPLQRPPVPAAAAFDCAEGLYRATGVFCSFPCGKAYLAETRGFAAGEAMLLLENMARDVFRHTGDVIPRAPPRHRLRKYGGDLDVQQFHSDAAEHSCYTLRPPLLSRPEVYERHGAARETEGWSVRGTRAHAGPASGGRGEGDSDARPSMYKAFLAARPATAAPLERSADGAACDLTTFIKKR